MLEKRRRRALRGTGEAVVAMGLLAVFPCGALGGTGTDAPSDTAAALPAHAARTMSVSEEAHLSYVRHKSSGSHLFEEGAAHGALPGSVHAECTLGATFAASVTIYTSGGTIHGHGTATPHASGIYESFSGKLTITGGTGRYTHAHGNAGLSGLFNRRTYALTVHMSGSLSY